MMASAMWWMASAARNRRCGIHVIQYQKKNPKDAGSHYHLDANHLHDSGKNIGGFLTGADAPVKS